MEFALRMPGLIEPTPIADDFIQGIAKIEVIGPCARFILYADHTIPEEGGKVVSVIIRKIVIPMDAIPAALMQTSQFLTKQAARHVSNIVRIR